MPCELVPGARPRRTLGSIPVHAVLPREPVVKVEIASGDADGHALPQRSPPQPNTPQGPFVSSVPN